MNRGHPWFCAICCSAMVAAGGSGQGPSLRSQFIGSFAYEGLGSSVGRAGDINGDGIPDLIIGSPRLWARTGAAKVVSGANGLVLYQFVGAGPDQLLGLAVAGAGDVNNDCRDDVIIGAPGFYDPESSIYVPGTVYVHSGMNGSLLHSWTGVATFGASVAGAGDVDNDGYDDVIVGAPGIVDYYHGIFSNGSVHVYSGQTGALVRLYLGSVPGKQLGASVSGAGDVNQDGRSDFLFGGPGVYDPCTGYFVQGSVYLHSGATGALIAQWGGFVPPPGACCNDGFGRSVAPAGDIDGDGVGDVAVGAPAAGMLQHAGRISIHSTIGGGLLREYFGTSAYDQLGTSLAQAGDLDGDGAGDLIAGAPQRAYGAPAAPGKVSAWSGAHGGLLFELTGGVLYGGFGAAVAGVGDQNGDGYDDFIVGAPFESGMIQGAGAAYVYTSPVVASWCSTGNVFGLGGAVDVLGAGTGANPPSSGGTGRTVSIPTGSPEVRLWMARPPLTPGPAPYFLFAREGNGLGGPAFLLPQFIGSMCFPPALLPPALPGHIVVGDSFGITGIPLPLAVAPGAGTVILSAPAPSVPVIVTLQGVILDAGPPASFRITNALRLIFY